MRIGIIIHESMTNDFLKNSLKIEKKGVETIFYPEFDSKAFAKEGEISDTAYQQIQDWLVDKKIDLALIESNLGNSNGKFIWKESFFLQNPKIDFLALSSYKDGGPGDGHGIANLSYAEKGSTLLTEIKERIKLKEQFSKKLDVKIESIKVKEVFIPDTQSTFKSIDQIVKDNHAHSGEHDGKHAEDKHNEHHTNNHSH